MTDLEGYYNIYKNIFRIPEEPFSNIELIEKRYHLENSIMTAIEHGNDILALKLIDKAYKTNALYIKRLEDELRDYKDYIITLNVKSQLFNLIKSYLNTCLFSLIFTICIGCLTTSIKLSSSSYISVIVNSISS